MGLKKVQKVTETLQSRRESPGLALTGLDNLGKKNEKEVANTKVNKEQSQSQDGRGG